MLIVLVIAVLAAVLIGVVLDNGLVRSKNLVENACSQISVHPKRRLDLGSTERTSFVADEAACSFLSVEF
ncbi:MAG: hypothetical protein AB8G26_03120 [Ilumatobacter sp.]